MVNPEISAVVLFSGGLDSTLATAVAKDQGLELRGFHLDTGLHTSSGHQEQLHRAAEELEIDIEIEPADQEYFELIRDPEHGYGSAMNPCLDCRIYMLKRAKAYLEQTGADFVISGEVLGQRPMTQRNKNLLSLVDGESGLEGYLVRPLSAKLLPPTVAEQKGWIDRDQLYGIQGRSRKVQLSLAEEYGITEYQQPAGGCLLADPNFGHRLEEFIQQEDPDQLQEQDLILLQHGRHFRLPQGSKAIIGRNEEENEVLHEYAEGKLRLEAADRPGPTTILPGQPKPGDKQIAARLTARYSGADPEDRVTVQIRKNGEGEELDVRPVSADDPLIPKMRIEPSS
ncbi:MAG: 7-cyano-7-deazaguanine synthase [Candidatus Bipolaricaulota bacterium]